MTCAGKREMRYLQEAEELMTVQELKKENLQQCVEFDRKDMVLNSLVLVK